MTLQDDLEQFGTPGKTAALYEKYNLLSNPFPDYGESRHDVCTRQRHIKTEFISIVSKFEPEAKHLRINGLSGAGKTNILRYFERLTNEARQQGRIGKIYPIYVSAPGNDYFSMHEQILDELLALFLVPLVASLRETDTLRVQEESRAAGEMISALYTLIHPPSERGMLFDPHEQRRQDLFSSWFKGDKLSAQDKKILGEGTSILDITSASLAIRYLDGFLQILRALSLCSGIVVLFDEFEEIFEVLSRSQQSRYAQDLRHLFDTLQDMTFFVVATTPNPTDLKQYPAIGRRLGEEHYLEPMDSLDIAFEYVMDYLRARREEFEQLKGNVKLSKEEKESLKPLAKKDVEEVYYQIAEKAREARSSVLPGHFLPQMRRRMQEIVEDSSEG